MPRRIRITLSYDGTDFHGWQIQPGLATIQGVLEEIVAGIEGRPVHVAGSGHAGLFEFTFLLALESLFNIVDGRRDLARRASVASASSSSD